MTVLPRYILGVDPGKKSGVALLDLLAETCAGWEVAWDDYGFHLEELIERYRPAVAVENFVINAATVRNSQATWSLRAIGVAEYLAAKHGCEFKIQAQSSAKRFATDERLTVLGWRFSGKGHLTDAQRQTLLYVVDHGWWSPLLDGVTRDTIDTTD